MVLPSSVVAEPVDALPDARGGQEDEEEEERVVYYDLDDSARRARALAAASERRASDTRVRREPTAQRILERPKPLFAAFEGVDAPLSDGDDDDEACNPFAALLQPPPAKKPAKHVAVERVSLPSSPSPPRRVSPPRAARAAAAAKPTRPRVTPSPKRTPPAVNATRSTLPTRAALPTRSLAPTFEAADARPDRWTRTSAAATKRRQSTSSALQTRQQGEAKRRKSMPATFSSLDSAPSRAGRRLSDVLSKATLLSQEKAPESTSKTSSADHSFDSSEPAHMADDGIADTVHEMREEQFQTQFFSPSKLRSASTAQRRSRPDAVLAKIRGSLGDAVRKAIRRTNRDLTLLRSQGQTLLARADEDSASEVHQREFVIVRLERLVAHPQLLTYDGVVDDVSMESSDHESKPSPGLKLTVVFTSTDAGQQLTRGSRVKIFTPFKLVDECFVPGARRKRRKFLIGTSLFEIASTEP